MSAQLINATGRRTPLFLLVCIFCTLYKSAHVYDSQKLFGLFLGSSEFVSQEEAASKRKSSSWYSTLEASNTAVNSGFDLIVQEAQMHSLRDRGNRSAVRSTFNVSTWTLGGNGGLMDKDRQVLGRLYREAESVFEYGLGESTLIANHVGVTNYAGIDSDPIWVASTRAKVASHFRFYLADIGETKAWGHPKQTLSKAVLQYQLAPLLVEPKPFDVYMVDGRFRFPCLMASFLHASARGETNLSKTIVLVHDCQRQYYHKADHLLHMERASVRLCVYRRRKNTTDEDLVRFWKKSYLESE